MASGTEYGSRLRMGAARREPPPTLGMTKGTEYTSCSKMGAAGRELLPTHDHN
jgi:hypothetical protein